MYLWKHRQAAAALRDNQVSDREVLAHYLALAVLGLIAGRPGLLTLGRSMSGLAVLIVGLIMVLWGLRRAFRLNQSGDGQHFYERLAVIGLPLTVRVMAFYVGLVIASYALLNDRPSSAEIRTVALWIGYLALTGWYYWRLGETVGFAARSPGLEQREDGTEGPPGAA